MRLLISLCRGKQVVTLPSKYRKWFDLYKKVLLTSQLEGHAYIEAGQEAEDAAAARIRKNTIRSLRIDKKIMNLIAPHYAGDVSMLYIHSLSDKNEYNFYKGDTRVKPRRAPEFTVRFE